MTAGRPAPVARGGRRAAAPQGRFTGVDLAGSEEARPLPALVRVDGAGQALRRLARLDALGPGGQRKVLDTQEVAVRGAAAVLGLLGIRTGLTALLAIPNYK